MKRNTKFFTNFEAWNPTIMRLELKTMVAGELAMRKDSKEANSSKMSCNSHDVIDITDIVNEMIRPKGELPTAAMIVAMVSSLKTLSTTTDYAEISIYYALGIFLNEAASKKIILTMDRIYKNAAEKYEVNTKDYYRYLYKHLVSLRNCVLAKYVDWTWSPDYEGLRSITAHDLHISMNVLDQMADSIKRIDSAYKVKPADWRNL